MTDFLLQIRPAHTGLSSLSLSHRLQQTVTHIPISPQQSLVFIWASSVGASGTPPLGGHQKMAREQEPSRREESKGSSQNLRNTSKRECGDRDERGPEDNLFELKVRHFSGLISFMGQQTPSFA